MKSARRTFNRPVKDLLDRLIIKAEGNTEGEKGNIEIDSNIRLVYSCG